MSTSSKEKILKKIRQALSNPAPLPFPGSEGNNALFPSPSEELDILFAKEFTGLLGKFSFCEDTNELRIQLNQLILQRKWERIYCIEETICKVSGIPATTSSLKDCDVSLTSCEFLIARTGSIVMSSAQESGRSASVYAPVHICIAYADQLVYDIQESLQLLKEKYKGNIPSLITFATGPSRTADIEKTLVVGVHGPKEVFLFLIDSRN